MSDEIKSQDFNKYWKNANSSHWIGDLEPWQYPRLKRIAFNAWVAGRKSMQS